MTRRKLAMIPAAMAVPVPVLLRSGAARSAAPIPVILYKNPSCSCCEAYAQYLDQNGFTAD